MHRSRAAINLLWQQRLANNTAAGAGATATARGPMMSSAAPPPPAAPAASESFLSGGSGAYVEEMYESWARDPTSVHASWDAYFRGISYTPPPALGNTRANEFPLSALGIICTLLFIFHYHFVISTLLFISYYHFLSLKNYLLTKYPIR